MSSLLDKSWIGLNTTDKCYHKGVNDFIKFAVDNSQIKTKIPCPCRDCRNGGRALEIEEVRYHCVKNGFHRSYVLWEHHGERKLPKQATQPTQPTQSDQFEGMDDGINFATEEISVDAYNTIFEEVGGDHNTFDAIFEGDIGVGAEAEQSNAEDDPTYFDANLNEALCSLYPGCQNFTVLRFVLRMFRAKVKHGLTDAGFTEVLQILSSAFPAGNKIPKNTYHAEKLVRDLGLKYQKIDACPNDCIIYWKEKEALQSCPTCKSSRYKPRTVEDWKNRSKQPAKQLRYFPITDRLKRLYSVKWVAKEMRWHSTNKLREGELGHPVDSLSWKTIDQKYTNFSGEPRNVRLGLATDGFNPFGMQSATYSCWPVMCVNYNLPPWLCMKRPFTMLALLVDGPREPGKDIDVFLRPLVEELKILWKTGALVKDANTGGMFNMRAVLLWTIHDFPAYGNISGCRTKGKYACPPCGPNTSTLRLHHGKKNVYLDIRRFCSTEDPMRKDVRESSFNKKEEHREQPRRLSGSEVKKMTETLQVKWGKTKSKDCEDGDDGCRSYFYKQSIFFELEYWEFLPIRHNLDVMHTEKNVCEILVALMLNTTKKTKDDINARKDLKLLGIKRKYWLDTDEKGERGAFCLRPEEKKLFLTTLRDIRVPVGFSSNWKNIVQGSPLELKGMKSHDYHILIQHLLPVLIQHAYKDRPAVNNVLRAFSTFFRALCSRRVEIDTLNKLEQGMVMALCELEKMCPPSLFVIMMHLPVHLAYEARILGPVFYRWMYHFERLMKEYKGYVGNKARPEGCIAERYLNDETIVYCEGYKKGGSILQELEENVENIAGANVNDSPKEMIEGSPVGVGEKYRLDNVEYEQVRKWVLKSQENYEMWETEYKKFVEICKEKAGKSYKLRHEDEFIPWLRRQSSLLSSAEADIARGPINDATSYKKCAVNGLLFITKDYQMNKRNQNSGVSTKCPTTFRSSAKDKNPIEVTAEYYGVLRKIIQVKYREGYSPILFKCDWVKLSYGVKKDDETQLVMVNLSNVSGSSLITDEPFILAEHVSQVFYSKDPLNPEWHIVIEVPRKLYSDMDLEGTVIHDSYARPINPNLNMDELIFNDMVEFGDSTRPRKKRRKN